jgi:hypothetical protein
MKSSAILFTGVFAITGCGGSGGDDDKGVTKAVATPYSFVLSDSNLESDENQGSVITILEQGAGNPTYQVQSDNPLVTGSVSGQQISITIGEFDRDTQVTLTIVGTQEGTSQSKTLMLDVTNTSVTPLLGKIDLLVNAQEQIISLADENALFEFVSNMTFRLGHLSQSERVNQQALYLNSVERTKRALNDALQTLSANIEKYNNADIDDSTLENTYQLAMDALNEHGSSALKTINSLIVITPSMTLLPLRGFSYIDQLPGFSQLIGHADLGKFENGQWLFTNEFEFLNKLLPSMSGVGQVCKIGEKRS